MSGTVNISRTIWHDAAFKDEPFTEREAFMWLVMEASWKGREKRVGNVAVTLDRGQLAASVRFMAEAWGWQKSTVDRFLKRLKKRDMIGTASGTGVNVITICKYDEYQNKPKDSGTHSKPKAGQQRDSSGTNENKGLIPEAIINDGVGSAHARNAEISDQDYERFLEAANVDLSKDVSGKWLSSSNRWAAERWSTDLGLTASEIRNTISETMAGRPEPPGSLKYFDEPMRRTAGRKAAPKLTAKHEQEQPHGQPRFRRQPARTDADLEAELDEAAASSFPR